MAYAYVFDSSTFLLLLWLIQAVESFGMDQESGEEGELPELMIDSEGVLRPSRCPHFIEYNVPSSS